MTVVPLGRGRRWGAVVLLRLASAILRGATALYLKRTISSAELRAALRRSSCWPTAYWKYCTKGRSESVV